MSGIEWDGWWRVLKTGPFSFRKERRRWDRAKLEREEGRSGEEEPGKSSASQRRLNPTLGAVILLRRPRALSWSVSGEGP